MITPAKLLHVSGLLILSLLGSQALFSQAASKPFFSTNDPLFAPGTNAGANPGYYGEWELVNEMPISSTNLGLDVNITGAWSNGYTGAGVIIGIADDGVQGTQPDLNFANAYSWDFSETLKQNTNSTSNNRGAPTSLTNNHGTQVAGIAAAIGDNGIGLTGAAPGAMVASLRLLAGTVAGKSSAQATAAAILYEGQTNKQGQDDPYAAVNWTNAAWSNGVPVRIKNHSYATQNGYLANPGYSLITNALATTSKYGVINVYAAGNYRPDSATDTTAYGGEDANKSQTLTDPDLITVAALGSDGKYASYSSYGANVFVTAPSGTFVQGYVGVPSTTITPSYNTNTKTSPLPDPYFQPTNGSSLLNYSSTFNGTSEAAPLVSGIMALGVQANTNLTLRLAQHLLALTSVPVDTNSIFSATNPSYTGGWITNAANGTNPPANAAGYHFNNNYGFGLVNATAFTTAAANVAAFDKAYNTNALSPLQLYKGKNQIVNQTFASPSKTNTPLSSIYNVNFNFSNSIPLPVEYIQIHLKIVGLQTNLKAYERGIGAIAGDISGTLTSPSGTIDQLFSSDNNIGIVGNRDSRHSTINWTFLTYAYYGESLNGGWTLDLTDNSTNTIYRTALKWSSFSITAGTAFFDTNAINYSNVITPVDSTPDAIVLEAVPEPSEYFLLLLGLTLVTLVTSRSLRKGLPPCESPKV